MKGKGIHFVRRQSGEQYYDCFQSTQFLKKSDFPFWIDFVKSHIDGELRKKHERLPLQQSF